VHTDEVYFRDTVHGFLSWAVAALAVAVLLISAIGSIISGGIQAAASVAGGVAALTAVGSEMPRSNTDMEPMDYFVYSLFRKDINATKVAADSAGSDAMPGLPPTKSILAGSAALEVKPLPI